MTADDASVSLEALSGKAGCFSFTTAETQRFPSGTRPGGVIMERSKIIVYITPIINADFESLDWMRNTDFCGSRDISCLRHVSRVPVYNGATRVSENERLPHYLPPSICSTTRLTGLPIFPMPLLIFSSLIHLICFLTRFTYKPSVPFSPVSTTVLVSRYLLTVISTF